MIRVIVILMTFVVMQKGKNKMADYNILDLLKLNLLDYQNMTESRGIKLGIQICLDELNKISKDVVEVKHGKWKETDAFPHNVYCSNCYKTYCQSHWSVWENGTLPRDFCPNCGADMRERREEENDK